MDRGPRSDDGDVDQVDTGSFAIAIFLSLRDDVRTFRMHEQRVLEGTLKVVALIFGAGFLVRIGEPGEAQGLVAVPVSALVYSLVFGLGVPLLLAMSMLVWFDTVVARELSVNRVAALRREFGDLPWPRSVADARAAGQIRMPRALHTMWASLFLFPGAALGSAILTLVRLYDSGVDSWLGAGWGWLAYLGGAGSFAVATYVAWGVTRIGHSSPNLQYEDDQVFPSTRKRELWKPKD